MAIFCSAITMVSIDYVFTSATVSWKSSCSLSERCIWKTPTSQYPTCGPVSFKGWSELVLKNYKLKFFWQNHAEDFYLGEGGANVNSCCRLCVAFVDVSSTQKYVFNFALLPPSIEKFIVWEKLSMKLLESSHNIHLVRPTVFAFTIVHSYS